MNFYLDINLNPAAEMSLSLLLNAVYSKLHRALWDSQSTDIGVSFPLHYVTLGNQLRLHGSKSSLAELANLDWLGSMSEYCNTGELLHTPTNVKFRTICRKQTTMSNAKLQRLLKRGTLSVSDIKKYKARMFGQGLSNPYVELISASNGQKHRRYFEFGDLLDNPVTGKFDQFGLSKIATIPWF